MSDERTAAGGVHQPDYPELQELAAGLLNDRASSSFDAAAPVDAVADAPSGIRLHLADLLSDDAGELLLEGFGPVELIAEEGVAGHGLAPAHVMASGEDVSGFGFVTLAGGTMIYFSPDIDLSVAPPDAS
ncbi:MAG: hypothetical protein KDE35_05850 [Geminicoccaceae bacterium]|nr:hypothetical protein [Geminicoccaceae bacterium]